MTKPGTRAIIGYVLIVTYVPVFFSLLALSGERMAMIVAGFYFVGFLALRCPRCRRSIFQNQHGWWTPIVQRACTNCRRSL